MEGGLTFRCAVDRVMGFGFGQDFDEEMGGFPSAEGKPMIPNRHDARLSGMEHLEDLSLAEAHFIEPSHERGVAIEADNPRHFAIMQKLQWNHIRSTFQPSSVQPKQAWATQSNLQIIDIETQCQLAATHSLHE